MYSSEAYEFVDFFLLIDFYFRNQKDFAEHIYSSLYGLSRAGSLGNLELLLLYAFRDKLDKIEVGV